MAKYRRKPIEVKAIQWTGLNLSEIKEFVGDRLICDIVDTAWKVGKGRPAVFMKLKTLEGDVKVYERDYIVKEANGEFCLYSPATFEKLYESADWGEDI